MPHPAPDNPSERLNRIEEATAFTDRSVEALTEQLLDLDRRMRHLATRLESLEGRLTGVAERLLDQPTPSTPREDPIGAKPADLTGLELGPD